jgi:hypothetical protein
LASFLVEEELQLQEDLNSARAKLGAAVNLHHIHSACQGTPTVLSSSQIVYLFKKNSSGLNGKDGETEDGETDGIYKFLEESGNSYMYLFLHVFHQWNQLL